MKPVILTYCFVAKKAKLVLLPSNFNKIKLSVVEWDLTYYHLGVFFSKTVLLKFDKSYFVVITITHSFSVQYLRGKCVSNNQCLGPNAACIGGLCACTEGYLSSSNNTRCRREMSWFVSFPLLGDRCMGFLSSCYNYDEQECKNERCVCKEGYRPLLEVERKLRHKEFSQCVKNDTLPGNIFGFCLKVF